MSDKVTFTQKSMTELDPGECVRMDENIEVCNEDGVLTPNFFATKPRVKTSQPEPDQEDQIEAALDALEEEAYAVIDCQKEEVAEIVHENGIGFIVESDPSSLKNTESAECSMANFFGAVADIDEIDPNRTSTILEAAEDAFPPEYMDQLDLVSAYVEGDDDTMYEMANTLGIEIAIGMTLRDVVSQIEDQQEDISNSMSETISKALGKSIISLPPSHIVDYLSLSRKTIDSYPKNQ